MLDARESSAEYAERIAVFISRRRISAPPAFAGIAIIAALIVVGRFTRMVKMK